VKQQEIDDVGEEAGTLTGYETKWNQTSKVKSPKTFVKIYDTDVKLISFYHLSAGRRNLLIF